MTERTIPCPKCNRKFATEHSLAQHKGAAGHGRRGKRVSAGMTIRSDSDAQLAYEMVDALDLPDGAHWAMLEELTGMEPADFAFLSEGR